MNEITQRVEELRQAMIDADKATLDDLTVEELSYGHSSGNIEDKAIFIKSIVSGKDDFKWIELSDQLITITGDTAIVRHRLKAEVYINRVPFNANIGVLLIWIKRDKWKLLARQAFK